jgi:magnesium and cobalt exporter, CNNM family
MIAAIAAIVFATLVISFFCSISEAALYSIPPERVESLRNSGLRGGRLLARLRDNVDEPISAILTLNTIANTVGSTVAGALVRQASGSLALGVFSAIFTMAILFCAEVIPKTLGVAYSRRLAPILAFPINGFIIALWPLVKLTQLATRFIRPRSIADAHSEEDLLSAARLSYKYGKILPDELMWLDNVLHLNDVAAKDIMTPRSVISFVNSDLILRDVKSNFASWNHSRIPVVVDGNLDEPVGIVMRRVVMEEIIRDRLDIKVSDLMKPAHFVPESMRGNTLLNEFILRREHLFLVVDEHGGTEGLVTLEDVIESLLGQQIVDEFDRHADMQEFARKKAVQRKRDLKIE